MSYIISLAELEAIVHSLKKSVRQRQPQSVETLLTAAVNNRFASSSDIKDIFYYSDERLDTLRQVIAVDRWCEIFSISVCDYYEQPRRNQSFFSGSEGLSAEDLAYLLISLERTGYSIDPLLLVKSLSARLNNYSFVTDVELNILLYEKNRHKTESLVFSVRPDEIGSGSREEQFKTATGYKIEVIWNEDAKPIELTVKAPKYRSRPAPQLTECEICGDKWYRGDPDSSASHRREHTKRLKYLDPKPNPRFSKERQELDGLFPITANSSCWIHGEIYLRALAFRREFQYDFVQWDSPKGDSDPYVRGYLFINSGNIAVGACAFRWREYDGKALWGLQWIWIAPKYRRSGILTKHWHNLRQLHGDFHLEPPVSDAMVAFVTKNGDQSLLENPNR